MKLLVWIKSILNDECEDEGDCIQSMFIVMILNGDEVTLESRNMAPTYEINDL